MYFDICRKLSVIRCHTWFFKIADLAYSNMFRSHTWNIFSYALFINLYLIFNFTYQQFPLQRQPLGRGEAALSLPRPKYKRSFTLCIGKYKAISVWSLPWSNMSLFPYMSKWKTTYNLSKCVWHCACCHLRW